VATGARDSDENAMSVTEQGSILLLWAMSSPNTRHVFLLCILLLGFAQWQNACAHKDDYLGDTFVFVTLDHGEAEAEYWVDWRSDPKGFLHTAGFEYGVTDHFMLDVSARYAAPISGPDRFETEFGELRYRFGDEGEHLVDVAASLEWENDRGTPGSTHRLLEPRLVLSKDFSDWNATVNLVETIVLARSSRSALEGAAGIRSPNFGAWNFGVELQRERALETATRLLPQLWYRLSQATYIKAGLGYNLAGEHNHFVRVAIETEF
jgi:hypothetical protein